MRYWAVIAGGKKIESNNDALPKQIKQIRTFVDARGGFVPVKPFLSAIEYDEEKPETVLAAAYAWLEDQTGIEPRVETIGIRMPNLEDKTQPGVIH